MRENFLPKLPLLLAALLLSCSSLDESRLEQALVFAGSNREELEKVLAHYAGEPEKLSAARFLIMNMPGHTGVDSSCVENMRPLYEAHAGISEKHQWERSSEWYREIDSLWKKERFRFQASFSRQDVRTVKAAQLIREIDRSLKAWKENAYTRDGSFEGPACWGMGRLTGRISPRCSGTHSWRMSPRNISRPPTWYWPLRNISPKTHVTATYAYSGQRNGTPCNGAG